MTKTMLCPNCEQEHSASSIDEQRTVDVRGETYTVHVNLWECSVCNEEFEDPEKPCDELLAAYSQYRAHHSMLQPEELTEHRKSLGFSMEDLARVAGCLPADIWRAENGALITPLLDKAIQGIKKP